jgi:hypothetical protein
MALTEWPEPPRFAHRPTRRGHRWLFGSGEAISGATCSRLQYGAFFTL